MMKNILRLVLISLIALATSGCIQRPMIIPEQQQVAKKKSSHYNIYANKHRQRTPIPIGKSQYEGSLWASEASWGNLFRDHRARFVNDVLSITSIASIVSLEKAQPVKTRTRRALPGQAATTPTVARKATLTRSQQEQNDVLRAMKTITARVTRVFPNGTMRIQGEKIDYRRGNTIRYVTKVRGIIRPEDINAKNEIVATKLARSEIKIRRQLLASSYRRNVRRRAGFLNRLNRLATGKKIVN
ncbi:MAG: flagellar basal body L-ring protein FlgH [bacterium]|jgi:flagellar basal body L-ring protein FlgH